MAHEWLRRVTPRMHSAFLNLLQGTVQMNSARDTKTFPVAQGCCRRGWGAAKGAAKVVVFLQCA